MFNSEFCMVDYKEDDNVVLLKWKKFACNDNYRDPIRYALGLLKKNSQSNFIVDAKNGFEDENDDVEWGISEFIPNLAKTNCKSVIFIMSDITDIENEMDMWTKAFKEYFNVYRVKSYEDAIEVLK